MKTKFAILLTGFVLSSSQSALATDSAARTILTCKTKDSATLLTIDENRVGKSSSYSVQLIDPSALQPVARLQLWRPVERVGSILTIDHFESFVGDLQMVVVFPTAGFRSKHVYFQASFGLENSGKSYGLMLLQQASSSTWTCED